MAQYENLHLVRRLTAAAQRHQFQQLDQQPVHQSQSHRRNLPHHATMPATTQMAAFATTDHPHRDAGQQADLNDP
jgi:hypothetical protein